MMAAMKTGTVHDSGPTTGPTGEATERVAPGPRRAGIGMTRADPWAEFLRRILLSASLAGVGGLSATAAVEEASPAAEIAEVEPQPPQEEPAEPGAPRAGSMSRLAGG